MLYPYSLCLLYYNTALCSYGFCCICLSRCCLHVCNGNTVLLPEYLIFVIDMYVYLLDVCLLVRVNCKCLLLPACFFFEVRCICIFIPSVYCSASLLFDFVCAQCFRLYAGALIYNCFAAFTKLYSLSCREFLLLGGLWSNISFAAVLKLFRSQCLEKMLLQPYRTRLVSFRGDVMKDQECDLRILLRG